MSFMYRLISSLVIVTTLCTATTYAELPPEKQKAIFETLTQSPDQPTMKQIFDAFGGEWPTLPEFYYDGNSDPHSELSEAALDEMAMHIAIIERAFPNAVIATLGRDAQAFGVWFEAFWISLGQFDRRIHLAASGSSFNRRNYGLNSQFLIDSGIDLFGSDRKYLIYDRTSYAEESQARSMLKALFWAWMEAKRDPVSLISRLSAVTFPWSLNTPEWFANGPLANVNAHFEQEKTRLRTEIASGIYHYPPSPSTPLLLSYSNSDTPMADSAEWHNGYSLLEKQDDGKVRGLPGGSNNIGEAVLHEQLSRVRQVTTPEFLVRVQKAAASLGYVFPLKPQTKLKTVKVKKPAKPKPITWKELQNRLEARRAQFQSEVPDQSGSTLTPNADSINDWYSEAIEIYEVRSTVVLKLINLALEEKAKNRISARDSRYLIATAMRDADLSDELFVKKLTTLLKKSQSLRNKFTEARKHYFAQKGSFDQFEWVVENIIRPNGWECQDALNEKISEEDAS